MPAIARTVSVSRRARRCVRALRTARLHTVDDAVAQSQTIAQGSVLVHKLGRLFALLTILVQRNISFN